MASLYSRFNKPKASRTAEGLVTFLADDIERLLALQSDVSVATSAEASSPDAPAPPPAFVDTNGRDSPPPEAPPSHHVEWRLLHVKLWLCGEPDKQPDLQQSLEIAAALLRPRLSTALDSGSSGQGSQSLSGAAATAPVLCLLVSCIRRLPFESRKHVATIFGGLMRREPDFWKAMCDMPVLHGNAADAAATSSLKPYPSLKALLAMGMALSNEKNAGPEVEGDFLNEPGVAAGGPATDGEGGSGEGISSSSATGSEVGAVASGTVPDLVLALVLGCGDPAIALNCGNMLRDAIRDQVRALMMPRHFVVLRDAECPRERKNVCVRVN